MRNIKTASTKRGFYMKFRNALLIIIVLLAGALFAAGLAAFSSQVYAGTGSARRVSLGIELPDVPIRTKTPSPVPGKDPTPSTSPNKTSAPTPSPNKTSTPSPSPTPVTTAAPTESVPATAHTNVPATAQTTTVPAVTSSAAPTATNAVITLPLDDFETALPSPDTTDSIAATVSATGNTSATDNASATDSASATDNNSATPTVSATDNVSASDSASVPATGVANGTPDVSGEKVNQKGSVPVWGIVFSAAGIICIIASFILLLINRSKKKR